MVDPFGKTARPRVLFVVAAIAAAAPAAHSAAPESEISASAASPDAALVKLLRKGDFEKASLVSNAALNSNPSSAKLHMLNALAYEGLSLREPTKAALAEQGFRLAIRFDRTNWLAQYLLGRRRIAALDWEGATEAFSEALLLRNDNADVLYALGVAAYRGRQTDLAAGVASRLLAVESDSERALRLSAFALAALGDDANARVASGKLAKLLSSDEAHRIEQRLDDWRRFHARNASASAATTASSASQFGHDQYGRRDGSAEPDATKTAEPGGERMVVVDVVIIGTEENSATSAGINLLNNLAVQFGDFGRPAGQLLYRRETGALPAGTTPGSATLLTAALTVPAISYSLNISNAATDRSEVLARPSLVGIDGKRSSFFSGLQVQAAAAASGAFGGSPILIEKDVGITLAVTPSFLADRRVRLVVEAERTFLRPPSTSVEFSYRLETSKTKLDATVVLNFGETLVLSGLSEKETGKTRNGVPGLSRIPGLEYLFSRKTSSDFQKTVLILLTPREPQYSWSDDPQIRAASAGSKDGSFELRGRFADWFRPFSNSAAIFAQLQDNVLYREFRNDDLEDPRWREKGKYLMDLERYIDELPH